MKVSKLVKLQEACLRSGSSFKAAIDAAFTPGSATQEADRADLRNISFQEIAEEFLGFREFRTVIQEWPAVQKSLQYARVQETSGGVVTGSTFQNISGFMDAATGLVGALVLDAYNSIEKIAKELTDVRQVRVDGGKRIKMVNDGKTGSDLAWGEELPSVGGDESWVDLPRKKRYGNKIKIDQSVFLYDLTGNVQEMAINSGEAPAYQVETDAAKVIMGITNSYSAKGTTGNTYLSTNGAGIMAYTNFKATTPLVDWRDINTIQQLLEGNTDPFTGFLITVKTPTILVMPQNELQAQTIIRATEIMSIKGSTLDTNIPNTIRSSANPVGSGYNLRGVPRLWYNLLYTSLSNSATNAQGRWYVGDFKKAFCWLQTIPFKSFSLPLAGDDLARGTVFAHACEEVGVMSTIEPRYVGYGAVE